MSLQVIGTETGTSASTLLLTVPVPAGTQEGDLLVFDYAGTTTLDESGMVVDNGWTLDFKSSLWSSRSFEQYHRLAGASEPSSLSFEVNNEFSDTIGALTTYRGADQNNPVVAATGSHDPTVDTEVTLSSLTSTRRLSILHSAAGGTGQTWTPPVGHTEVYEVLHTSGAIDDMSLAGGRETLAATGATGTRTWTASAATQKAAGMLIINPVSGSFVGFVGHRS